MEVHAHSHTPRKKWTHYFWEFLMLFLAVFCGFLAEYQLEHKIEKDREKQLIKILYQDLKFDTTSLKGVVKARKRKGILLDSLAFLLIKPIPEQNATLYYLARSATRLFDSRFIPNDGAMQQLKNAGGLRLVHHPEVAAAIIKYDVSVRYVLALFQQESLSREEYMKAASLVFDGSILDSMVPMDPSNSKTYGVINRPANNPPFAPDKERLFQLRYWIHYLKGNNVLNQNATITLLQQAETLLQTLKKEYHLK